MKNQKSSPPSHSKRLFIPLKDKKKEKQPKPDFNIYFRERGLILQTKYPFLTASQIKGKARETWKKMSNDDRSEFKAFIPQNLFKSTPSKSPARKQTKTGKKTPSKSPVTKALKTGKNTPSQQQSTSSQDSIKFQGGTQKYVDGVSRTAPEIIHDEPMLDNTSILKTRHPSNKDNAQVSFSSPSQWLVNSLSQPEDSKDENEAIEREEKSFLYDGSDDSDEDKARKLDELYSDFQLKKQQGKQGNKAKAKKGQSVKSKIKNSDIRSWLIDKENKVGNHSDSDGEKTTHLAQLHQSGKKRNYSKKGNRKKAKKTGADEEQCENDVKIGSPLSRLKNRKRSHRLEGDIRECFGFDNGDEIVSIMPLKEYMCKDIKSKSHPQVPDSKCLPSSTKSSSDGESEPQNSQTIDSTNAQKEEPKELFKTPSLPGVAKIVGKGKKETTPAYTGSLRSKGSTGLKKDSLTTPLMPDTLVEQTIQQAKKAPRKRRHSEMQNDIDHSHNPTLGSSSVAKKCARKSLDAGVLDREQDSEDSIGKVLSPYEKRKQKIPNSNSKIKITPLKRRKRSNQQLKNLGKQSNQDDTKCDYVLKSDDRANDSNSIETDIEPAPSESSNCLQSTASQQSSQVSSIDDSVAPLLQTAATLKLANTYRKLNSFDNMLSDDDDEEEEDDHRWMRRSSHNVAVLEDAVMALRKVTEKKAPSSPPGVSEVTSPMGPSPALSGISFLSGECTDDSSGTIGFRQQKIPKKCKLSRGCTDNTNGLRHPTSIKRRVSTRSSAKVELPDSGKESCRSLDGEDKHESSGDRQAKQESCTSVDAETKQESCRSLDGEDKQESCGRMDEQEKQQQQSSLLKPYMQQLQHNVERSLMDMFDEPTNNRGRGRKRMLTSRLADEIPADDCLELHPSQDLFL